MHPDTLRELVEELREEAKHKCYRHDMWECYVTNNCNKYDKEKEGFLCNLGAGYCPRNK